MEPINKLKNCCHLQKIRENYCHSCHLYLCTECFLAHINYQNHISGNKQELQAIIQNELLIVTQKEAKLEEFILFTNMHKLKIPENKDKKEYIEKYTKSESDNINSNKLGAINRGSAKEGKYLLKELKHIGREYKRLLHDIEQRVGNNQGMLAIRVIDEEKFQFYSPEGCPEPKISDLLREEIFNQLELLENTLTLENINTTSNIDQIFKFILILFGIIFSILSILLIIYSYKGAKILEDYDSQTYIS